MPPRLLLALLGAALLTGCPGSIDDPARFRNAAGGCDDFDVEADLFQATCAQLACHTGGPALAAAGLDLGAPGVGPRLMAHRSTECGGRPLIDPYHLDDSYLIEKLDEDAPECGDRMPAGLSPLNPVERACLAEYLNALAASATGDGAVPPVDAGVALPRQDAGAPVDAGAPTPVVDAGPPSAVVIEAETMTLAGYAPDAANPTVIRVADAGTSGTASTIFEGPAAHYRITLHVWAEVDGQPTLTLRVAGAQIAQEMFPPSSVDFEPVALGPFEADLAPGDTLELEGQVAGGAWARVDRLEVSP